jgi:acetyl-CoA carboxylase biotin carboxylase subunit
MSAPPFRTVLIANRGEIALRIARTCREMGIRTVAVYSSVDRSTPVVSYADEAIHIGPDPARRSYLYIPNLVEAALRCGADAIHPGYGFLSEDPDFAQVCAENDITFIGPPPEVMELLGDKARVRAEMGTAGLPILPGSDGCVPTFADAEKVAREIGFPLVVKAAAGGGGRGIEVVHERADLESVYRRTAAYARQSFGNGDLYLERYVTAARHVEVQVLGDAKGAMVHLGERDCSMQRRNQKLIEEAPSARLSARVRVQLGEYAVAGARHLGYTGAGTMEFLVAHDETVTFMEINGRIQVEHPVTEMLVGMDLVREQIQVAAGASLAFSQQDIQPNGAAIECRINAEDPDDGFRPTPGRLDVFRPPGGPGIRVDTGYYQGDVVPPNYDSLVAKLVVWAPSREEAIARADRGLAEFAISGPRLSSTIPLLRKLLAHPAFVAGEHTTRFVDELMADRTPTRWSA